MSHRCANAEIILVRTDGALLLQLRDDKPGIANPGFVTTFGGHIEPGEEPLDAAAREINEETNLNLAATRLNYFGTYHKTKEIHGEDWDVYYYVAYDVSDENLQVFEGQGHVVVQNKEALDSFKLSPLADEVLRDFFDAQNPQD